MAFQPARRTRTLVLTVPVWPESGFRKRHPAAVMSYAAGATPAAWTRHPRPRRMSEGHLPLRHGSVPGPQQHQARAGDRLSRGSSGAWTGRAGTQVDPATRSARTG